MSIRDIGYQAGFSFFVNHTLSIGADFSGHAVINSTTGGLSTTIGPLQSTQLVQRDSMFASVRMSYQITSSFGVNPTIGTGLTDGMPDVFIGASAFWNF